MRHLALLLVLVAGCTAEVDVMPDENRTAVCADRLHRARPQELDRRAINWPTRMESSSLDLTEAYVRHGFGIGLSVEVPGRPLPAGLRSLPLRGFPQLAFGALSAGRLPATAASFLELARLRAKELAALKSRPA